MPFALPCQRACPRLPSSCCMNPNPPFLPALIKAALSYTAMRGRVLFVALLSVCAVHAFRGRQLRIPLQRRSEEVNGHTQSIEGTLVHQEQTMPLEGIDYPITFHKAYLPEAYGSDLWLLGYFGTRLASEPSPRS